MSRKPGSGRAFSLPAARCEDARHACRFPRPRRAAGAAAHRLGAGDVRLAGRRGARPACRHRLGPTPRAVPGRARAGAPAGRGIRRRRTARLALPCRRSATPRTRRPRRPPTLPVAQPQPRPGGRRGGGAPHRRRPRAVAGAAGLGRPCAPAVFPGHGHVGAGRRRTGPRAPLPRGLDAAGITGQTQRRRRAARRIPTPWPVALRRK